MTERQVFCNGGNNQTSAEFKMRHIYIDPQTEVLLAKQKVKDRHILNGKLEQSSYVQFTDSRMLTSCQKERHIV